MKFQRTLRWSRRVALLLAALAVLYLTLRFEVEQLPNDGCSPLRDIAPGDRLVFDTWTRSLELGDTAIFRTATGELLLGRVTAAPNGLTAAAEALLSEGALWFSADETDCPGRDSRTLGPIELERVEGRMVMTL